MVLLNEIAKRFARGSGFKITHSSFGNPKDGGFFQLQNHEHGTPFKPRHPPMMLQLIDQIISVRKGAYDLQGAFIFYDTTGRISSRHHLTAHSNGAVSLDANNLTHAELAYALRHAKRLQKIMRSVTR